MATFTTQAEARASVESGTYSYSSGGKTYVYKKNSKEATGRKDKLLSTVNEETGRRSSFNTSSKPEYVEVDVNAPQNRNSAFSSQITDFQKRERQKQQITNIRQSVNDFGSSGRYTPVGTDRSGQTIYLDTTTGKTLSPVASTSQGQLFQDTRTLSNPQRRQNYSQASQTDIPERNPRVLIRGLRGEYKPVSRIAAEKNNVAYREIGNPFVAQLGTGPKTDKVLIGNPSSRLGIGSAVTTKEAAIKNKLFYYKPYNQDNPYPILDKPLEKTERALITYSRDTREFNEYAFRNTGPAKEALKTLTGTPATAAEVAEGSVNKLRTERKQAIIEIGGAYAVGGAFGAGEGYLSNVAGRTTNKLLGVKKSLKAASVTKKAITGVGVGTYVLVGPRTPREFGQDLPSTVSFAAGTKLGSKLVKTGFNYEQVGLREVSSSFGLTDNNKGLIQVTRGRSELEGATLFGKKAEASLEDFTVLSGSRTRKTGEILVRGRQVSSYSINGETVKINSQEVVGGVKFSNNDAGVARGLFLEPQTSGKPAIIGKGQEFVVEIGEPTPIFKARKVSETSNVDTPYFSRTRLVASRNIRGMSLQTTQLVPGKGKQPVNVFNYVQNTRKVSYRDLLFERPREGSFVEPSSLKVSSTTNTGKGFEVGKSDSYTISDLQVIRARNVAIRSGAAVPSYDDPAVLAEGARLRNRRSLNRIRDAAIRGKRGSLVVTETVKPSTKFVEPKLETNLKLKSNVGVIPVPRYAVPDLRTRGVSFFKLKVNSRFLQRQNQREGFKQVDITRTLPKIIEETRQIQEPRVVQVPVVEIRQSQVPIPDTRVIQRVVPREIPDVTPSPPPPPPFGSFYTPFGSLYGGKNPNYKVNTPKRQNVYLPDLFSASFGVKAPKGFTGKSLTGIELRPIPKSKKVRGKLI